MCLPHMIKGGINWQDVREFIDTCVLFKFSSPKNKEGVIFWPGIAEHLAFSSKTHGSFNIIYMRGSIYIIKRTSWKGGLFMHP